MESAKSIDEYFRQKTSDLAPIIARAAPPQERLYSGSFEPVETESKFVRGREEKLFEAFGSRDGVATHAERLGISLDDYLLGFRDARLVGELPDWGRAFCGIHKRLGDTGDAGLPAIIDWMRSYIEARWPEGMPHGPEALSGPLNVLARSFEMLTYSRRSYEHMLGIQEISWGRRFEQSPVLAFVIGQLVSNWRKHLLFMLRAAAKDRPVLANHFFNGEDPGELIAIDSALGDPHAGGQSVSILRFSRGGVVFKSKDLRLAWAMGRVAKLLSRSELTAPKVVLRGRYAWENLVEANPILENREAENFYRSLGGWLGVLHYLGAMDFWFDNLLADGETPRFVDFETLIQPEVPWPEGVTRLTPEAERRYQFDLRMGAVGILPFVFPTREGEDPCDLGCVSKPGRHPLPVKYPDRSGETATWLCEAFAPRFPDGQHADISGHFDSFEAGYLQALDDLSLPKVRKRILEIFEEIDDAPVRMILIDTWTCYRIIQESMLPSVLSDSVWREIRLHRYLNKFPLVSGEIREAASRDLRCMDIPLFVTRPNSRDIWGTRGERKRDFFPASALESIRRNEHFFRPGGGQQSREVLRTLLSQRQSLPPRLKTDASAASPAKPDDLLEWAEEIGSEICDLAVRNVYGHPNWISLTHNIFSGVRFFAPMAFDVLSGRSGLASALIDLGDRLGRSEWTTLGVEALAGAADDYVRHIESGIEHGAGHAVGAGGLVLTLSKRSCLREHALRVYEVASDRKVWMYSGGDYAGGLEGWREAVMAIGEAPPENHGRPRPYAPSALPRLARWIDPAGAVSICRDRRAATSMRKSRDGYGTWFADRWIDHRHDLSGIDGIPALANVFVTLAADA